jgi:hypothetical protein
VDILEMLGKQLSNPEVLGKLSQKVGAEPSQVASAAQLSIPTLLQALNRNASTEEGAESLFKALAQHEDDDVDDVNGFLDKVDTVDGSKILQHIFSGNKDRVENNLAKQTGLKSEQITGVLSQLAPLILGSLGKQKKQEHVSASGLAGMLGGLTGDKQNSSLMGAVNNFLDADNDGSALDDIGNLLGKFLKKN